MSVQCNSSSIILKGMVNSHFAATFTIEVINHNTTDLLCPKAEQKVTDGYFTEEMKEIIDKFDGKGEAKVHIYMIYSINYSIIL